MVFYNGNSNIPEQCILKLSDAFIVKQKGKGCLEVETLMLDINVGRNKQLMEGCKYLKDYSVFVENTCLKEMEKLDIINQYKIY